MATILLPSCEKTIYLIVVPIIKFSVLDVIVPNNNIPLIPTTNPNIKNENIHG